MRSNLGGRLRRLILIVVWCGALTSLLAAAEVPLAVVSVRGLGLVRDHSMRRTLILLLGNQRGPTVGASAIDDAALILISSLEQDGYLEPSVSVAVTDQQGRTESYEFDRNLDRSLPRSLAAREVVFHVRRGKRFTVTEVTFTGLTAIRADQAQTYFRAEGMLARLTAERAYSPARLRRSVGSLLDELNRRGYAEASVAAPSVEIDHQSGNVRLGVAVTEGPLWRVSALKVNVSDHSSGPANVDATRVGMPWTDSWRHDVETDLRRWYFERGYPDVRIAIVPEAAPAVGGKRDVVVRAEVTPGPFVRLGRIEFVGNTRTKESAVRPLVKAKAGQPLNPLQTQDGEYRISRLGVFSSVNLRYEPDTGPLRDAVYQLQEGKRRDVDLLLGYGSYEELRAGIVERDYDLFGMANEGTLKLVQSMKTSEGEYDYTVPELFGSSADGTAKLFGFRRNERAFVDEQYGANLSVGMPIPTLKATLLAGYTYQYLHALNDTLATVLTDTTHANATSVQALLTKDRRDNPLQPRHGYKAFLQIEEASRLLGGRVDFQDFQFGGSYHTQWGRTRWIHAGLTHGLITTYGEINGGRVLPPNVLFYPGGEDSIRGFTQGEAAPRAPNGQFLGAKAFTLLNLELEQALTSKWSLVVFGDALGATATMSHYPFDYRLYSLGLGMRFQTIVGPIRVEYGRNLNPRPQDPPGSLHFSIGFPF